MQDRFAMNERQTQSGGRLGLYPEIVPYRTGRLKVSALHELYYEECGNPDGKPAVLLHGGPGGGSTAVMRRYHDPSATACAVRSAGLRPLDAACQHRGEHHLASRRRYRAAPPTYRDRALAGVRRLMGLDARACLCRDAPREGERACLTRHIHAPGAPSSMVLSGGL